MQCVTKTSVIEKRNLEQGLNVGQRSTASPRTGSAADLPSSTSFRSLRGFQQLIMQPPVRVQPAGRLEGSGALSPGLNRAMAQSARMPFSAGNSLEDGYVRISREDLEVYAMAERVAAAQSAGGRASNVASSVVTPGGIHSTTTTNPSFSHSDGQSHL